MNMNDTQILSTFQELPPHPRAQGPVLVFDACHSGVVLRALLFVEVALAVGTMFTVDSPMAWLEQLALFTSGALPATLVWLLAACLAKHQLAKLQPGLQYGLAIGLGVMVGLYGCGMLAMTRLLDTLPWMASACSGALLAAIVVGALVLRAKGRTPADTAARLAELQSRIHPHFLFNTLNSAIALVRAEPAKAESLLEDLSDLFRHALMDQGAAVTLAEEITLAQRYLAIEQVRFGERLQVQWSLDPAANDAKLPPLLLQPLVENAVRHGVEPSAAGASLHISTQRRGAMVVLKLSNTVPAGQGAGGHGLALRNVQDRLTLLHDVQAQFRCGLKDGVYLVRMEFPA